MNDHESRVRPVSIYYPSAADHPYGYGYMDMRRFEPAYINFKSGYPYSQQHSRAPAWEGMFLSDVKSVLPHNYRVINLYNAYYRDHYDPTRLTLFVDDQNIITSLTYS
jgi:hypothetical protein